MYDIVKHEATSRRQMTLLRHIRQLFIFRWNFYFMSLFGYSHLQSRLIRKNMVSPTHVREEIKSVEISESSGLHNTANSFEKLRNKLKLPDTPTMKETEHQTLLSLPRRFSAHDTSPICKHPPCSTTATVLCGLAFSRSTAFYVQLYCTCNCTIKL